MRDILFRGKRLDNGEWIYGSLLVVGDERQICVITRFIPDTRDWETVEFYEKNPSYTFRQYKVDPETVGQWTGLVDKNGVKIFDGDIVDTKRWYVRYLPDFNGDYGMAAGWYLQRDNFESWQELEINDEHEVLGNIYDNPELLERKPSISGTYNKKRLRCIRNDSDVLGGRKDNSMLTIGEDYTLANFDVYDLFTLVELEEFPGLEFNSVLFEEVY